MALKKATEVKDLLVALRTKKGELSREIKEKKGEAASKEEELSDLDARIKSKARELMSLETDISDAEALISPDEPEPPTNAESPAAVARQPADNATEAPASAAEMLVQMDERRAEHEIVQAPVVQTEVVLPQNDRTHEVVPAANPTANDAEEAPLIETETERIARLERSQSGHSDQGQTPHTGNLAKAIALGKGWYGRLNKIGIDVNI